MGDVTINLGSMIFIERSRFAVALVPVPETFHSTGDGDGWGELSSSGMEISMSARVFMRCKSGCGATLLSALRQKENGSFVD